MSTMRIQLTRDMDAVIDTADHATVMAAGAWHAVRRASGVWYARHSIRVSRTQVRQVYLHQLLTGWELTDHIDGDGLNNTRANLRPATIQQNAMNRSITKRNTTGFKGVDFYRGRFRARLGIDGRQRYLGIYATAEEAARVYDAAARTTFGAYARLNFPKEQSA